MKCFQTDSHIGIMALMKAAQVWEKFILKDLTTFARYAKVELTPPGPGDLVGAVKGVGKLAGDALTFKWAQVTHQGPSDNVLMIMSMSGLNEGRCRQWSCCH